MTVDPSPASGFSRVLQGQELSTLRGAFTGSNESESLEKPLLWNPSVDEEKLGLVSASRRYGTEKCLPVGRPESSFTDLLSGFGSQVNASRGFCMPPGDQSVSKQQPQQEHDAKFSWLGNNWSTIPPGFSLNLMDSGLKNPGFREFSLTSDLRGESQQTSWLMPPPVSPYLQMSTAQSREIMPKSVFMQQQDAVKPKESNCKLFGIPLISKSATESDQPKGSKMVDNLFATSEQEKQFQSFQHSARDRESKSGSTRSCTKVIYHLPTALYINSFIFHGIKICDFSVLGS